MQTLISTSSTLTPPLLQNKNLLSIKRSYKQRSISNHEKKKTAAATTISCKRSPDDTGGLNLRNVERAIKLQSAISNKSAKQLLELIGNEWRYFCEDHNPKRWRLNKKSLELFHELLVKNNVMLVIKPTEDRGVDIGLSWFRRFGIDKVLLGSGWSISTNHLYEGMVLLRNAMGILNVLAQMKIAQKLEEEVLPAVAAKLLPKGVLNEKERIALMYALLSVAVMVASLFIFKNM